MGSMSASDAAPLPRLGEVYFDVRGESRSMRLSWYADTGVAVFSIWQGGTCTGTFRLPIADLPRMIDALQRGPHGDAHNPGAPQDGPRGATELHAGPGQHGRPGYGPGQSSGDYSPDDLGGYGRTVAHSRYEQETRAGYPDDSLPGGAGGHGGERGDRYEDEPTGIYRGDPLSQDDRNEPGARHRDGGPRQSPSRGHQDDPLTGSYRADPLGGSHQDDVRTSGYREEPPAGVYRDDPLGGGHADDPSSGYGDDPRGGYQGEPFTGSYRAERHGGYTEGAPAGGYQEDPRGGFEDEPPGGDSDDPLGRGYRDDPRGAGYPDDSLTRGYPADPPDGYREDPRAGGHPDDSLTRGYPADPPDGYREDPRSGGRRRAGDYQDDRLTDGYPGEPQGGGYPGEFAGEPMTAHYGAEPSTGDYPTGPWDPAIDDEDYPAPAGNAGYSPARPYVAPVPGGAGGAREGRGRQRRRPGAREESDPSPDSFPYGRSSAEPEVRGRGR
jgi:hypothetical protein